MLPSRSVYKKKYGPTSAVKRYKACWVVKGFHQVEGIDYDETFASVVKSMIWKSLLALGANLISRLKISISLQLSLNLS